MHTHTVSLKEGYRGTSLKLGLATFHMRSLDWFNMVLLAAPPPPCQVWGTIALYLKDGVVINASEIKAQVDAF